MGFFQAKILEWVAISYSGGDLPDPGIEPASLVSPALAGEFFTTSATWEAWAQSRCSQMPLEQFIALEVTFRLCPHTDIGPALP